MTLTYCEDEHPRRLGYLSQDAYEHMIESSKTFFAVIMILVIQSDNNFAHATTAELSRYVQNCDLIGSSYFMLEVRF